MYPNYSYSSPYIYGLSLRLFDLQVPMFMASTRIANWLKPSPCSELVLAKFLILRTASTSGDQNKLYHGLRESTSSYTAYFAVNRRGLHDFWPPNRSGPRNSWLSPWLSSRFAAYPSKWVII